MRGGNRQAIPTGIVTACTEASVLADGVELLGEYRGSGYREAPWLLRQGGVTMEVSPLLYLVCSSLGPGRDLAQVAATVSARSGREATPADIAYLLEHKLAPLGVLASGGDNDGRGGQRTAPRALALTARRAVVSSSTVRRLTTPLQFLFLAPAVAVALVALVAMDVAFLMNDAVAKGTRAVSTADPELVVLLIVLALLSGAFHELGHATACRYGGAEPGVIGIGIYLIWPVFYNDLNDSYRLERRGRVRADLGGVYFNVVFMVVLGAGYLVTGFEPLVVAVAWQHLAVLQQFLPFVRLDGYYLVSDLAGVPDLFGRIWPIVSASFPGRPVAKCVTQLTPRARAIVTAWVLVTVPALAVVLVLFVARLPGLASTVWSELGTHGRSLVAAMKDGAVWGVALDGVQLAVLLVPPVGIILTVYGTLGRRVAARVPGRAATTPGMGATPAPHAGSATVGHPTGDLIDILTAEAPMTSERDHVGDQALRRPPGDGLR